MRNGAMTMTEMDAGDDAGPPMDQSQPVEAQPDAKNPDEYDCTCPKCGANFTVQLADDTKPDNAGITDDTQTPQADDSSGLDDAGGFSFARGR